RQRIVGEMPAPLDTNKAVQAQVCEMLRGEALPGSDGFGNLADRLLAFHQETEDHEAVRTADRAKHPRCLTRSRPHFCEHLPARGDKLIAGNAEILRHATRS